MRKPGTPSFCNVGDTYSGTTTIAASLVEPSTGKRLAAAGALNPQRAWGADVLARLEAAGDPATLRAMQACLAAEMERLTDELLGASAPKPRKGS